MFLRLASVALAAAVIAGTLAPDAYANHRKRRVIVYDPYYAGPVVVRPPGLMRLMFGGYRMTPEEYDAMYGPDQFDESYYDPQLDEAAPPPKPRKTRKPVTAGKTTAPVTTKKPLTTASVSKPATAGTDAETAKKPVAAASVKSVSCTKAGEIVSGYGFSAVQPADCDGQVYAFNATRDGKSFSIKLNAASGELTEVKKLQ